MRSAARVSTGFREPSRTFPPVALSGTRPRDATAGARNETHDLTFREEFELRVALQATADALLKEGAAHGAHRETGPEPGQASGGRIGDSVGGLVQQGTAGGRELGVETGEVLFEDLCSSRRQTVQVAPLRHALAAGQVVRGEDVPLY